MATTQEHKPTFFERAEVFLRKYRNVLIGLVVVAAGVVLYKLYTDNKRSRQQKEAVAAMINPTLWWSAGPPQDSLALYGDGISPGFLEIVDNYGKTKSGNLANFYAGVSYMRRHDYDNAIKHLDAFRNEGTEHVGAQAKLLLGHSYAQLGDSLNAAEAYADATMIVDNNLLTPMYLKIAGDYHYRIGKGKEAEELYSRIRDEYPMAEEARDIERFIAMARQSQN